jgi:hypothetical protein
MTNFTNKINLHYEATVFQFKKNSISSNPPFHRTVRYIPKRGIKNGEI